MQNKLYFVNAFMEVDEISSDNESVQELKSVGNLFADKVKALNACQRMKKILKES